MNPAPLVAVAFVVACPVPEARVVRVLALAREPTLVVVAADGAHVAAVRDGNWVDVHDAVTGRLKDSHRFHDGDRVEALAFSPDGRLLAAGARDNAVVRVWDARTGHLTTELGGHDGGVREVAFTRDGREVVTTSVRWERTRTFDLATGTARPVRYAELLGFVPGLVRADPSFSPDGRTRVLSGGPGGFELCEMASGQRRWEARGFRPYGAAFGPGGRHVAVGSFAGGAGVWDADTGALVARVSRPDLRLVTGVGSGGGKLFVAGEAGVVVCEWPKVPPTKRVILPAARRSELSAALAGPDAVVAFAALRELAADPGAAVAVAEGLLRSPTDPAVAAEVAQALDDLSSDRFADRDAATRRLRRLAPAARAEVFRAYRLTTDREVADRLERVIAATQLTVGRTPVPAARALELLERVNTPAARAAVKQVADGEPGLPLPRDAAATLARMAR